MAKKSVFEIFYGNRAREFRWRLRATNGEIVASSGEGFKQRAGVVNAIRAVKLHASRGVVQAVKVSPARLTKKTSRPKPKAKATA